MTDIHSLQTYLWTGQVAAKTSTDHAIDLFS